jgi:hypothetical protein
MPLLESVLAQPQATFDGKGLLTDLFEMAAAYLFHREKLRGRNGSNRSRELFARSCGLIGRSLAIDSAPRDRRGLH